MNFDLIRGQTLGVVGESGSGKSTLARLLLKLIPATSGEVTYRGQNILPLKERQSNFLRRDMQMIFQDPYASLDPRIRIGDSIAEPLWEHKLYRTKDEVLERVGTMLERV